MYGNLSFFHFPKQGPCKYVLATDRDCPGADTSMDYGGGTELSSAAPTGKFEVIAENIPCDEAVGYSCVKDLQVGSRIIHSQIEGCEFFEK